MCPVQLFTLPDVILVCECEIIKFIQAHLTQQSKEISSSPTKNLACFQQHDTWLFFGQILNPLFGAIRRLIYADKNTNRHTRLFHDRVNLSSNKLHPAICSQSNSNSRRRLQLDR